jgi:hypothetical protein
MAIGCVPPGQKPLVLKSNGVPLKSGIRSRASMKLNEILEDPSLSLWLKDAIKTAYERDPVDALHDARRLLKMLAERYTQIVNRIDPLFTPVRTVRRKELQKQHQICTGKMR